MPEAKGNPVSPDQLSGIVAGLQAQAQAQVEEKQLKALVEINTKAFDRSAAYNNIILVAGYAGGFTIWSFTRAQLPEKANVAIALGLLVSLATFITFEVVKMLVTGKLVMGRATVLKTNQNPAEKLQAIKDIEEAQATILIRFMRYWAVTMVASIAGAGIALVLLAYNFVAVLIGWPRWPT